MNHQCQLETVTAMLESRPGVPPVRPDSKIGAALQRVRTALERGDTETSNQEIAALLRESLLDVHPIIHGRLRALMNGHGDVLSGTPLQSAE